MFALALLIGGSSACLCDLSERTRQPMSYAAARSPDQVHDAELNGSFIGHRRRRTRAKCSVATLLRVCARRIGLQCNEWRARAFAQIKRPFVRSLACSRALNPLARVTRTVQPADLLLLVRSGPVRSGLAGGFWSGRVARWMGNA